MLKFEVFSKIFFHLLLFLYLHTGWAQTNAPRSVNKATHQVEQGDTYYRLSRLYQVPIDSLQRWNGPDLKLGTTIRVKAESNANNLALQPETEPTLPVKKPAEAPVKSNTVKPPQEVSPGNRLLVIPFDPALYFSDADNDIAWQSKIEKQKVRYIFQARLSALLQAPGYQTINPLNNPGADNGYNLEQIYKSLAYSYQDVKYSGFQPLPAPKEKGLKAWVKHTKEKVGLSQSTETAGVAQDENKYYGVKANDPAFFTQVSNSYGASYLLFINQFEIFTDYSNCIDRTTQNFVRNFRVHYTIYNDKGELVAGNKVLVPYESNVNDINKIVRENMGKIATRIMADLPRPEPVDTSEARN